MEAYVDKYCKQGEKDTNLRTFLSKKYTSINYVFHYNLVGKELSTSLGLPFSRSMLKVYFYSKIHFSHSGCHYINQTKRTAFQFSPLL